MNAAIAQVPAENPTGAGTRVQAAIPTWFIATIIAIGSWRLLRRSVDMAIDALTGRDRVHPRQRETGGVVVKRGAEPRRRAMALLAGLWEACRHMVRIGRALEIF